MPRRPLTEADLQNFQPVARPQRTPAAASVQSAAGALVDDDLNAQAEARRSRLRPLTEEDAPDFEPVTQMRSAREDAAGRGFLDYIAEAFNPSPGALDPEQDATAFLADLRRHSPEGEAQIEDTRRATANLGDRFAAVFNDAAQYNSIPTAARAGEFADAEAEADRRARYAEGFRGREFWNTDQISFDDLFVEMGPDGRPQLRRGQTELRGLPAAAAAGAADISGAVAGGAIDPAAWLSGGETLLARILSNLGVNVATDAISQGVDIASGAQDTGYDPVRTAVTGAAGAALPAAVHVAGEVARNAEARGAQRDALRQAGREPVFGERDAPDEAVDDTARFSRGADVSTPEAERAAGEDAANRARSALRERGVNPDQPGYREAFEAERAAQTEASAAGGAAPPAAYARRARADLEAQGVTPRNNADFADRLEARINELRAHDSPEAVAQREIAEAQAREAFMASVRADPQARQRTNSRGVVSYVRDTGRRANGRAIVEELAPGPNNELRVVRERRVLPGELRDIERAPAAPAERSRPVSGSARFGAEPTRVDAPSPADRDVRVIPRPSEETVRSELRTDPGAKVRPDADQRIVREAASKGVDMEAVERYRSKEAEPRAGGEGRMLTVDEAISEMRLRGEIADGREARDKMLGETVARLERDERPGARDELTAEERRLSEMPDLKRAQLRSEELVRGGMTREAADAQANREVYGAGEVSRETEFTNKSGERSRAVEGSARFGAEPKRVDAQSALTPETTPLRARPEPKEGEFIRPRDGDRRAYEGSNFFPEPGKTAPKIPADNLRDVAYGFDGYVSTKQGSHPAMEGRPLRFKNAKQARAYAATMENQLRAEGRTLDVEHHPSGRGFALRASDPAPKADAAPAVRAAPLPPRTEPDATPAPKETPEVQQLQKAVSDLSEELTGLARTLKEQRAEMDDARARAQSRALERGGREAEPAPRQEPEAAPSPKEGEARAPETPGPRRRIGLATKQEPAAEPKPVSRETEFTNKSDEPAPAVDDIPNWKHDVTPERFAKDYLDEVGRPTNADRVVGAMKAGFRASAVIEADGKMRTLGPGQAWSTAFRRRAGLAAETPTSSILRATHTADIHGTGRDIYIRIPDEPTDSMISAVLKTARQVRANDPDVQIHLEVHNATEGPMVLTSWKAVKKVLDDLALRDFRPDGEVGSFRFMDPDYWGRAFADARTFAQTTWGELLGRYKPVEDIANGVREHEPRVFVVDRRGKVVTPGVGESNIVFGSFRKLARLNRRPEVIKRGAKNRAAGYLENDVLNATESVVIESHSGDRIEIRMPETLTKHTANQLRDAVNAIPPEGARARLFKENGQSPLVSGRNNVLREIDAAEARRETRHSVAGAMPFLDPAQWKRQLLDPSLRAMMRYLNNAATADPNRAAFWREFGEVLREPPKSKNRKQAAWRELANVHDTMIVSDIGALRGLKRRYPMLRISREEAIRGGVFLPDAKTGKPRIFGSQAEAEAAMAKHGGYEETGIENAKGYAVPYNVDQRNPKPPKDVPLLDTDIRGPKTQSTAVGRNRVQGWAVVYSDLEGRHPIEWLADQVGSEPGSGRVVPRPYEHAVAQDTKRFLHRVDSILDGIDDDAATNRTLAELLTGAPSTGKVTPALTRAAEALKRAFNEEWIATQQAGLDLGFRKNYLARNFDEDAIVKDPNGFIRDATDQYIDEGLEPGEAATRARALWANIVMPPSRRLNVAPEMKSTTPNPIASRQWKASADARMRRWYINDVRKLAPHYIRRLTSAREYARRFGQKGERMQAAYDAITRSVERQADRDLVRRHMNTALGHMTEDHGTLPVSVTGALSWVQVLGVTKYLARTFLLQMTEPANIALRENKGMLTAMHRMMQATGYLFDGSTAAKADRMLADMVGLTGDAAKEMFLDARMNGLSGNLSRRFVQNVFDSFGITKMTEKQRIFSMRMGQRAFMEAMDDVVNAGPTRKASLSLLGEYGVSEAQAPGLQKWIQDLDRMSPEDRAEAIAYGEFPEARAWRGMLHDFAMRSIIEPTAAETPHFAKHPYLRMAYSLQSFQHAFTREVLMRAAVQVRRAITDKSMTQAEAMALVSVLPAFVGLATVQILMQTMRGAVFSSQASSERTPLEKIITNTSRTGLLGIYDTAINTVSSNLRYERDPAGLATGPFLGETMNSVFKQIQGLPMSPGNSPNTNSAEWQGNKELWSTIIAPAAAGVSAQVPLPGPLSLFRTGASAYLTSSDASRNFATMMVGPKGERGDGEDWTENFGDEAESFEEGFE